MSHLGFEGGVDRGEAFLANVGQGCAVFVFEESGLLLEFALLLQLSVDLFLDVLLSEG